jgi:hypothetical protein
LVLLVASAAGANVPLTQISSDPFTNPTSQHATQVEPDTFAFGSTIVAAFQSGRFTNGGASDIGWATSTNGGASWTHGSLPLTKFAGGPYDRTSDPSVAYDAKHGVWLISALPIDETLTSAFGFPPPGVIVSRSIDGGFTWSGPITVAAATPHSFFDKNWSVCDDTPTSPFYGNCYTEWDDFAHGSKVEMSTSSDGGLTWGPITTPANSVNAFAAQPVVQPNGTVIVPLAGGNLATSILAFRSVDGGATWSRMVPVSSIRSHTLGGGLRGNFPIPSAEVDAAGKVYLAWQDCRFRRSCSANDIVFSTSTDGLSWSTVKRVPIDDVTSTVDHFIPGLAVDRSTSGTGAHLGLAYYYYPQAECDVSTCELDAGFVSSTNGGATWSEPTQLAGPMSLSWLPATGGGPMVGDYISTSFSSNGLAHPAIEVANPPTGSVFDEATYTPEGGLAAVGGTAVASSGGVVFTGTTAQTPPPPSERRRSR